MASLDKSNVVNGNTISASDITALYDAFTGTTTYDNIDFRGTSSNANLIKYVDDNNNKFYEVPFLATESLGSYVPILTDTNNSFQYNPSTETLKATNFEGTGSYITGSNVQGPVEIAQNLDQFTVIDTNQNPVKLINPRPLVFTLQYSGPGSGSIDLNNVIPGIQSQTLGDDLFIHAQEMLSPGIMDTANSLEINYLAPILSITSSATTAVFGALVTGWAKQ